MTWRQHRFAIAGVLVVLGGLGLFMVFTGLAMHHSYTSLGLDTCGKLDGPSCQSQLTAFQQDYSRLADQLPHFLMILPGLIGLFVGAPLVARELESGTFRFAWTQGRSRVQWIVTKLVLLAAVLTALALAFSALFTWWYGPFDAITGRMSSSGAYETSGLVFAARTLFGFTLGALLGLLIRRTVPAMAATAAAWFAVVVPSMLWLRPLIHNPITVMGHPGKGPIVASNVPFNANLINNWIQNSDGHHVGFDELSSRQSSATAAPRRPRTSSTPTCPSTTTANGSPTSQTAGSGTSRPSKPPATPSFAIVLAVTTVLILRRRAV